MFSAVAAWRRGAMVRRFAWDIPRGGYAHAVVLGAVPALRRAVPERFLDDVAWPLR
jgi:hypothetical protein